MACYALRNLGRRIVELVACSETPVPEPEPLLLNMIQDYQHREYYDLCEQSARGRQLEYVDWSHTYVRRNDVGPTDWMDPRTPTVEERE
jgi:hypothetical protein